MLHWHLSLIAIWKIIMELAKNFQSGRNQAVHFAESEVAVKNFGNGVLLLPPNNPWQIMQEALTEFEPDFKLERAEQHPRI